MYLALFSVDFNSADNCAACVPACTIYRTLVIFIQHAVDVPMVEVLFFNIGTTRLFLSNSHILSTCTPLLHLVLLHTSPIS